MFVDTFTRAKTSLFGTWKYNFNRLPRELPRYTIEVVLVRKASYTNVRRQQKCFVFAVVRRLRASTYIDVVLKTISYSDT